MEDAKAPACPRYLRLRLGEGTNVDDEVPDLSVVGATRTLRRHFVLAIADDVEKLRVLLTGKSLGIGPIVERELHAGGYIGLAVSIVPVAQRAIYPIQGLGPGLRFGSRLDGIPDCRNRRGCGGFWGDKGRPRSGHGWGRRRSLLRTAALQR